ncbi:flavodoxin [Cellulomonas marina]|nr:flavodoxin [Cellulomonas marina]
MLVAVASRHGATWEIGEAVARVLGRAGHEAEVVEPGAVGTLEGYDAVVLGSAVYLAHWVPVARELAARLADELRERPVWLFSSGLATQPAASANSPHELAELRERIGARGHRSFRGRLDRSLLSFAERAVIAGGRAREGDHRDFAAVEAWAAGIADELSDLERRRHAAGVGARSHAAL